MTATFRYDRRLIVLHWLTAALIAGSWIGAQLIDFFPRDVRPSVRSAHILVGLVLTVALLARLVVRRGAGNTPPAAPGWLAIAGRIGHVLLYVLIAAAIGAGMANAWVRGESLFGFLSLAGLAPPDKALRRAIGGWHELAANALLVFALGHAAMALFHHYVLRDGLLRRMLPAAR